MRSLLLSFSLGSVLLITISSCTSNPEPNIYNNVPTQEELVERGRYLVTTGACNDCHSPKIFSPTGLRLDSSRLLSGHPAVSVLPPIDLQVTKPGYWILMAPDVTAFVGPWGTSYAANLTPDSSTGIGAWRLNDFINTFRTGKHLGLPEGRHILPPMPFEGISKFSDEDLKAIFTYLHSLPPVSNKVPEPVNPGRLTPKISIQEKTN